MNPARDLRDGSDEELGTFLDLDEHKGFADSQDLMHSVTTEKKVDADFYNGFEDDYDETDMKRAQ